MIPSDLGSVYNNHSWHLFQPVIYFAKSWILQWVSLYPSGLLSANTVYFVLLIRICACAHPILVRDVLTRSVCPQLTMRSHLTLLVGLLPKGGNNPRCITWWPLTSRSHHERKHISNSRRGKFNQRSLRTIRGYECMFMIIFSVSWAFFLYDLIADSKFIIYLPFS